MASEGITAAIAHADAELRARQEEFRGTTKDVAASRKELKRAQAACRRSRMQLLTARRQRKPAQANVRHVQRHLELCKKRGWRIDGARKRLAGAREKLLNSDKALVEARRSLRLAHADRKNAEREVLRAVERHDRAHAKVKVQALKLRQAKYASRSHDARAKRMQALAEKHRRLRRGMHARHREAEKHLEARLLEELRGFKRKLAGEAREDTQRRRKRAAQYAATLRNGDPLHADKFHRSGASLVKASTDYPDFSGRLSVLSPKGGKHEYTLVYLHQFCLCGTNYVDWKPHYFFSATKLPYLSLKVTLPTAKAIPVTVHGGIKQYAWYDYKTDHEGRQEDQLYAKTLRATRDRIFKILDREVAMLGGDASRVFLGGASQGCCTALHCALTYPKELGGFVGIVGHLLSSTPLPKKKQRMPIYLYNGKQDQVMRWSWVRETYGRFKEAGYTNVHIRVDDGVTHEKPVRKEREWIVDFLHRRIPRQRAK